MRGLESWLPKAACGKERMSAMFVFCGPGWSQHLYSTLFVYQVKVNTLTHFYFTIVLILRPANTRLIVSFSLISTHFGNGFDDFGVYLL